MSVEVKIDDQKMKDIKKLVRQNKSYVKVGILGGGTREKGVENNASIGLKHEFGKDGMPQRSFLRAPLVSKFKDRLAGSRLLKDKNRFAEEIVRNKSFDETLKVLGLLAEEVIQDAFDSHGFGQWKKSDMKHKRVHLTLVETTQLRQSISSEVVS